MTDDQSSIAAAEWIGRERAGRRLLIKFKSGSWLIASSTAQRAVSLRIVQNAYKLPVHIEDLPEPSEDDLSVLRAITRGEVTQVYDITSTE
jgi:hypothetical protein